jgi:para-aminobenzoate synthetase component 1
MTRSAYHEALFEIQDHLQRGDIYEVNYCQEFIGTIDIENPFIQWLKLLQNTSAPFAAYMQHEEWVLICASPERFLQRKGQKLISQPIKGTARRSHDPIEDDQLQKDLAQSPKDRSENIMIVDLVRNDLSRLALKDTVKVKELCGVYAFKTVYHLISTIEALIPTDTSLANILRATFPMGSMTGAPKISAIQIAEKLENFSRGWYSGSIGFVAPNGDFDFNVIIRSAIYHRPSQLLRCGVGGAITMASMAEAEYEETLLKANAIRCTL